MTIGSENKTADQILKEFDDFYGEFRQIPDSAKLAFEQRNHRESLKLSGLRLSLYSNSIKQQSQKISEHYPEIKKDEARWDDVEQIYKESFSGVYHRDLALAYLHSIRRKVYGSEWRTNDYSFSTDTDLSTDEYDTCYLQIPLAGKIDEEAIRRCLQTERFSVDYEDIQRDVELILARLEKNLVSTERWPGYPTSIEMFKAGFFRNRGAYFVGRLQYAQDKYRPLIFALLNGDNGLTVDALITSATYAHNMFSSTLANFHVTNHYYHEVCYFLKSIMPMRPLGLHYTTIGYNHLGKVAVMNDLEHEVQYGNQRFTSSPGAKGTVAIGFAAPNSAYHAKVIRDTPTDKYKWGKFDGIQSVLGKYTRVHEINRSDSMLDSMLFYKLRLPKSWFEPELLSEILEFAGNSVTEDNDGVIFRYLIVQRKLTPLPIYLDHASEKQKKRS